MDQLCGFIVRIAVFFLRSLHLNPSPRVIGLLDEFIRFSLIGLSNTAISFFIYITALYLLRLSSYLTGFEYLIAFFISFVLSVLWSFYWNKNFVFKLRQNTNLFQALLKTYISYSLTGLILSGIMLYVLVDILGFSELFAPLVILMITVPLNFFLNKFWSFK